MIYTTEQLTKLEQAANNIYEASGVPHLVSIEKLAEVGAQNLIVGRKWNPKNEIYVSKSSTAGNKFFDLRRTIYGITDAYKKILNSVKLNESILFVATKNPDISAFVKEQCMATDSLYITKRWLGGILTNFKTVKKSISRLNELNNLEVTGEIKKYGKKERIQLAREAQKLENFIGGVKKIGSLPKLIVVLDPVLEHIAVQEASKIGASVIALSNSDANTKNIDYNIPCNTKSKKTCWLILSILFDAIKTAKALPVSVVEKTNDEIVIPYVITPKDDKNLIKSSKPNTRK